MTRHALAPLGALVLFPVCLSVLTATAEGGSVFGASEKGAEERRCAPVTTADPFDLDAYAVHPWYVQRQQVVRYQPKESLYCVRASYTVTDDGVSVLNTANVVGEAEREPTQRVKKKQGICLT